MSLGNDRSAAGRPRELTEVKRAEICALLAAGCSYRTAAAYVGCTAAAISMAAKRDAEFSERLTKAVAQREVILLSYVRGQARRSWRAGKYMLETTVGGRYGGGHVPTLEEEVERELHDAMMARVRLGAGDAGVGDAGAGIQDSGVGIQDSGVGEDVGSGDAGAGEWTVGSGQAPGEDSGAGEWIVGSGQMQDAECEPAIDSAAVLNEDAAENTAKRAGSSAAGAKAAVAGASGAAKSGDSIQRAMDAIERFLESREEADDEKFFEIDYYADP